MITELRDFYLLNDKLLYARRDFIGFNPTISKGLIHDKPNKSGKKVKLDEFEMRGSSFTVILTYFIDWGPLKGYERVEILKNGRTIICYESGSKGYGYKYSDGNYFFVENENAYLIAQGYAMINPKTDKIYLDFDKESYYFFWFDNIIIPNKHERDFERKNIPVKEIYTRQEIESLRQIDWEANANFNNTNLQITHSSIPGFSQSLWRLDGHEEFRKNKNSEVLWKTEITINHTNSNGQQNSR